MVDIPQGRSFSSREDWRAWLEKNYAHDQEIWLIIHKKHSKKPSVRLNEAVEEALCFGWIDGRLRRIDEDSYALRFTPRRKGSIWSENNINRVRKMIREGKMTEAGLEKFKGAPSDPRMKFLRKDFEIPQFLVDGLKKNGRAWEAFERLTPSLKKQYVWWIVSAKKEETRKKRIEETARRCLSGKHT